MSLLIFMKFCTNKIKIIKERTLPPLDQPSADMLYILKFFRNIWWIPYNYSYLYYLTFGWVLMQWFCWGPIYINIVVFCIFLSVWNSTRRIYLKSSISHLAVRDGQPNFRWCHMLFISVILYPSNLNYFYPYHLSNTAQLW